MEYVHISQINFADNINERVFGIFLAQDVEICLQKDGSTKYLKLIMMDKETRIKANKFGASEEDIRDMQTGKVYIAAIDVKLWKGDISCNIYNFSEYDESPSNFIPWAEGMQESYKDITWAMTYVAASIYGTIVNNILQEHWQKFSVWSAATGMHHNLMGGLLVHTAEVVKQSVVIADFWNLKYGETFINKPLLISAALLHDVAKTKELNVDTSTGQIGYSIDSALETHITMCVNMIEIEAYKLGFGYKTENKSDEQVAKESEALKLLKHCVLAHHGKKDYGSPIDMNCPEANILNTADCLSAEMYRYNKNFKHTEPGNYSSNWLSTGIQVTYKDSGKI